jgi:hypothetical protein
MKTCVTELVRDLRSRLYLQAAVSAPSLLHYLQIRLHPMRKKPKGLFRILKRSILLLVDISLSGSARGILTNRRRLSIR